MLKNAIEAAGEFAPPEPREILCLAGSAGAGEWFVAGTSGRDHGINMVKTPL